MNYQVYVKSHSEAPDFTADYSEEELKARVCQIPYVEDTNEEDSIVSSLTVKCGGTLEDVPQGFKCKSCGQIYDYMDEETLEELQEKVEVLHDDYLEAESTGN